MKRSIVLFATFFWLAMPTDPLKAANDEISKPPTSMSQKIIIFGSDNSFVYCFNETDGSECWKFRMSGFVMDCYDIPHSLTMWHCANRKSVANRENKLNLKEIL